MTDIKEEQIEKATQAYLRASWEDIVYLIETGSMGTGKDQPEITPFENYQSRMYSKVRRWMKEAFLAAYDKPSEVNKFFKSDYFLEKERLENNG